MKMPMLRFKADDGSEFPEWEEKKFGDIWKRTAVKNDGSFGGDKIISVANMKWAPKDDVRDDYLKTYNLLPLNAIAFEGHRNNSYSYGRFVLNDIGEGIVSHVFACFEPIADIIPAFWKEYIHAECVMGQILRKCTKFSTMMHDLVVPDFLKQIISVPSLPEQRKIADLLSAVDAVIAAQQAEVDAWEQRKKGVMQKLFSQEVRFKADDGSDFPDWESTTVGELFAFVTEKNKDGRINNVITNSAEMGLVPQKERFSKDIAVDGNTKDYPVIHKGDFVYNPVKSSSAPFGPFNIYERDEIGIVSPLYTCLTPYDDEMAPYLAWYFKTDRWHLYIVTHGAQSGARYNRVGITMALVKGIPVLLPSISEQRKIVDCLVSMDEVIQKSKGELAKWWELKKGLLQQMFA